MASVNYTTGDGYLQHKNELLKQSVKEQHKMAGRLLIKALELKHSGHVKGVQKLERKIKAEKGFLESVWK